MQNYCKTIGALAAATALVAGNASAEVEYELHTGYSNKYIFRGVDLGDDLVEAGLDVATSWNCLDLSAGAWYGSYSVDGVDFDELDLYGEVAHDFGFATGAIGYIIYLNMPGDDAQEVYFSVGRDFGFVDASFTYFQDIETDNDGYSELALSKSFELSPCVALNVDTNVSFLFEEGDFGAWNSKLSLDWGFVENAKLSPFVGFSLSLDDDYNGGTDEWVGGSMLSVSF